MHPVNQALIGCAVLAFVTISLYVGYVCCGGGGKKDRGEEQKQTVVMNASGQLVVIGDTAL